MITDDDEALGLVARATDVEMEAGLIEDAVEKSCPIEKTRKDNRFKEMCLCSMMLIAMGALISVGLMLFFPSWFSFCLFEENCGRRVVDQNECATNPELPKCSLSTCLSGVWDAQGVCCHSGVLDVCGICGGHAKAIDSHGVCCSGDLDADGSCCYDVVDEWGVCSSGEGGNRSIAFDVTTTQDFVESVVSLVSELCDVAIHQMLILQTRAPDSDSPEGYRRRLRQEPGCDGECSTLPDDIPRPTTNFTAVTATIAITNFQEDAPGALSTPSLGAVDTALLKISQCFCDSVSWISLPRPHPFCGNGQCEIGESCNSTNLGNCCRGDCRVVQKSCPRNSMLECSGNGICIRSSGVCECWRGYGGSDCSACAFGYSFQSVLQVCVPSLLRTLEYRAPPVPQAPFRPPPPPSPPSPPSPPPPTPPSPNPPPPPPPPPSPPLPPPPPPMPPQPPPSPSSPPPPPPTPPSPPSPMQPPSPPPPPPSPPSPPPSPPPPPPQPPSPPPPSPPPPSPPPPPAMWRQVGRLKRDLDTDRGWSNSFHLEFDPIDHTPYLGFQDLSSPWAGFTVAHFDGKRWTALGGQGNAMFSSHYVYDNIILPYQYGPFKLWRKAEEDHARIIINSPNTRTYVSSIMWYNWDTDQFIKFKNREQYMVNWVTSTGGQGLLWEEENKVIVVATGDRINNMGSSLRTLELDYGEWENVTKQWLLHVPLPATGRPYMERNPYNGQLYLMTCALGYLPNQFPHIYRHEEATDRWENVTNTAEVADETWDPDTYEYIYKFVGFCSATFDAYGSLVAAQTFRYYKAKHFYTIDGEQGLPDYLKNDKTRWVWITKYDEFSGQWQNVTVISDSDIGAESHLDVFYDGVRFIMDNEKNVYLYFKSRYTTEETWPVWGLKAKLWVLRFDKYDMSSWSIWSQDFDGINPNSVGPDSEIFPQIQYSEDVTLGDFKFDHRNVPYYAFCDYDTDVKTYHLKGRPIYDFFYDWRWQCSPNVYRLWSWK